MRSSAGNQWLLDNIRQPEVHLLQRKVDTANRQAAHTDERADHSQAARGAGRRGEVGARREATPYAGWLEGLGIGTGGET